MMTRFVAALVIGWAALLAAGMLALRAPLVWVAARAARPPSRAR